MSVSAYKNCEVLYIIIFRNPDAKIFFQKWLNANRHAQARIDDNRLHIYDHNTFNSFSVSWANGWDQILVWDTFLKRHIYM
jgi:hypothetical protein